MKDTLSNTHNEDEQVVNTPEKEDSLEDLFAAAYSGDDDEASRLQKSASESNVEDTTDSTSDEEGEQVDEQDGIDIASVNLNEDEQPNQASQGDDLAELKEQLHRAKSDAGRVPHLNRRVQELERQLASLQSPADKPDTSAELPSKLKEKLDRLREVDPDLADTMEEAYRANAEATNNVASAYQRDLELRKTRQEEEYVASEYNKLVAAIPEAEEVFRSPEWERWVGMLSPNHKAMANSSDANEVITAIQAFKVDAAKLFGGYKWGKTTAEQPTPQVSATARAAETSREQRLKSSASVKTTAARANNELDLEALFKQAFDDEIQANKR